MGAGRPRRCAACCISLALLALLEPGCKLKLASLTIPQASRLRCTNGTVSCACDVWELNAASAHCCCLILALPLTPPSTNRCLTPSHAYCYLTPLRVQVVSLVQNGGRPEIPAPAAVPGGAFAGDWVYLDSLLV